MTDLCVTRIMAGGAGSPRFELLSRPGVLARLARALGYRRGIWYVLHAEEQATDVTFAPVLQHAATGRDPTAPDTTDRDPTDPDASDRGLVLSMLPPERMTAPDLVTIKRAWSGLGLPGSKLLVGQTLASAGLVSCVIWRDETLTRAGSFVIEDWVFHAVAAHGREGGDGSDPGGLCSGDLDAIRR